MKRQRRRLTTKDARRVNAISAIKSQRFDAKVQRILRAVTDPDKARRLADRQCLYCFYLPDSRLAGQAFTKWQCRYCDHEGSHPNTHTPECCSDCSDELGLCVDCGGRLDMQRVDKLRRRRVRYREPCSRCGAQPPKGALYPFRWGASPIRWLCMPCREVVAQALEKPEET